MSKPAGWVAGALAVVGVVAASACGGSGRPSRTLSGGECSLGKGDTLACYGTSADTATRKTEAEIIERANQRPTVPLGVGPWPFAVVRTKGAGLPVRTTASPKGVEVGRVAYRRIAWAWCRQAAGTETPPAGPYPVAAPAPIWFKVTWPNTTRSTATFESTHGETRTAWTDGRYLVPTGHDGAIPLC